MDVDPLQDAPPARYAVESDSEDEIGFYPGPRPVRASHTYVVEVEKISNDSRPLVIICGPTGASWTSGLDAKATGSIKLDSIQVAEYKTTSSDVEIVLMSHRLPLNAQHPVARAIIDAQKPANSILIIDSYSHLVYISDHRNTKDEYPLRHLCTSSATQPESKSIEPYAPPNLLQNISAAVMAECEYLQRPATTLLIPTRNIGAPAPIKPTRYGTQDDSPPSVATLEVVTQEAAAILGVTPDQLAWTVSKVNSRDSLGKAGSRARHLDLGEGGMYI